MAGPLQAGDIIAFGRLAWEVYQLGWSDDRNATRQYSEFGRDVKGLAESLDILEQVVGQARTSLRRQGLHNAGVRWDPTSLMDIIGDYDATLRECKTLLKTNGRYRQGSSALRNIEWNVLVQPSVDILRQRIVLHNSKILHAMKPFEIDLLCRVREDIYRVHQDLADRITAVHNDLNRLMGVLVPNLSQALDQQASRSVILLDIPMDVAERFRMTALADRPEYESDDAFELQLLSDAFILNYNKSTVNFRSGILVADRIPPVDQYFNLLKCVWVFKRIRDSPMLAAASAESHWPSYVRQLEEDLSSECSRFGNDLVTPDLVPLTPTLRRDMFTIWPDKEPTQLVDVVTRDEMMEQILESPLQTTDTNVERSVKLLRRMGSDGQRFRIIISGSEQTTTGRPRHQTETIDFDIRTVIINPQYALPTSSGLMYEAILHRDERIARLAFTNMTQVLKFQQAVTGYKAWASYAQYNAKVSFVVGGAKEPVYEEACIQLWIPKQIEGSLVTNTDASSDSISSSPSRSATLWTNGSGDRSTLAVPISRQTTMQSQPMAQPSRSPTMFSASWPRRSSPVPMGSSPPERMGSLSPTASRSRFVQSPFPSIFDSGGSPPLKTHAMSSPGNRSHSISSAVSTAPTSDSSGSDGNTKTISTGNATTGLLHRRPPKPLLVLFTQNSKTGKLSLVTINIDEETLVNAERCNCRRGRLKGAECQIAALERRKGAIDLEARRYEVGEEWNMARLAVNNPASTDPAATWPGLKRLSIWFPEAEARARFGGKPNECQCRIRNEGELTRCLKEGHRGLLGEVAEHWRRQLLAYHRQADERRQIIMR